MFYFVLALHIFLCVVLVTLVLLQQGKGASVGAVFSGSSNTLFGASGANTVLTKVTTGVAVAFMFTSVVLVRIYPSHASAARSGTANPLAGSVLVGQQAPAAPSEEAPVAAGGAQSSVAPEAAPVDANAAASVPAPQQESAAGSAPVKAEAAKADAKPEPETKK